MHKITLLLASVALAGATMFHISKFEPLAVLMAISIPLLVYLALSKSQPSNTKEVSKYSNVSALFSLSHRDCEEVFEVGIGLETVTPMPEQAWICELAKRATICAQNRFSGRNPELVKVTLLSYDLKS
ncbi:hypothetical protein NRC85_004222 [Vibrio parahaemolyticus]|nr:hypothetical protein [Vibrio parahaemolyticus]